MAYMALHRHSYCVSSPHSTPENRVVIGTEADPKVPSVPCIPCIPPAKVTAGALPCKYQSTYMCIFPL